MINYWATSNLLRYPDLQSWVTGWDIGKKFLNHRLDLVPEIPTPKKYGTRDTHLPNAPHLRRNLASCSIFIIQKKSESTSTGMSKKV